MFDILYIHTQGKLYFIYFNVNILTQNCSLVYIKQKDDVIIETNKQTGQMFPNLSTCVPVVITMYSILRDSVQ